MSASTKKQSNFFAYCSIACTRIICCSHAIFLVMLFFSLVTLYGLLNIRPSLKQTEPTFNESVTFSKITPLRDLLCPKQRVHNSHKLNLTLIASLIL